jgi:hypothetical protein
MKKVSKNQFAWVAAIIVAFVIYQTVSPNPFDLSFLGLTAFLGTSGGGSASIITIDGFRDTGQYTADIQYVDGTHKILPVTDGKLSFSPRLATGGDPMTPTGYFTLIINSVSLGQQKATFTLKGKSTCTAMKYEGCIERGYADNGMMVGVETSTMQWYMPSVRITHAKNAPDTIVNTFMDVTGTPNCPGYNSCYGSCYGRNTEYCGKTADTSPYGCSGSCSYSWNGDKIVEVLNKPNNYFKMNINSAGQVTLTILDANFYNTEMTARTVIPTSPHYRDLDCPIKDGYMVVQKAFPTGSVVAMSTFKYPINYFCGRMPVLQIDTVGREIGRSTDIYKSLLAGGSHTVPAGMTEEFFYVTRVSSDMNVVCDATWVSTNDDGTCPDKGTPQDHNGKKMCYSIPTLKCPTGSTTCACTVTAGLIHDCTGGGIWDSSQQSCTVQSNVKCVLSEPVKIALCKNKDMNYNRDKDRCERVRLRVGECPAGVNILDGYCSASANSLYCSKTVRRNDKVDAQLVSDTCTYTAPQVPVCDIRNGERLAMK